MQHNDSKEAQRHSTASSLPSWYGDTTIRAITAPTPDEVLSLQQWAADERSPLSVILLAELPGLLRSDSACKWYNRYLSFYNLDGEDTPTLEAFADAEKLGAYLQKHPTPTTIEGTPCSIALYRQQPGVTLTSWFADGLTPAQHFAELIDQAQRAITPEGRAEQILKELATAAKAERQIDALFDDLNLATFAALTTAQWAIFLSKAKDLLGQKLSLRALEKARKEAMSHASSRTHEAATSRPLTGMLDDLPAWIRRPLECIHGRGYAAIWPYVQSATPEAKSEQVLHIVRDDGSFFGPVGDKPLAALGLEVQLGTIPPPAKLWNPGSAKAYRKGDRADPGEVFDHLVTVIDAFLDFDRSLASQATMCEFVACYVLATWFLPAFQVIGYVWPNGGPGSGKTKLLLVVAELSYLGQVILGGSSYPTLRDMADYGATLCFDDAENVMDVKRGDPDKRALLLAGNRRGNTITVKEPTASNAWRTRDVHTFCARLFSAINLPDTVLASRTIIVPLVRTIDKDRANRDPLDADIWPIPRDDLLTMLWALALQHVSGIAPYEKEVKQTSDLLGRNLEPWLAILTVAKWLEAEGVPGIWTRMHELAQAYQQERLDLESPNLLPLTIRALCHCATSATSATMFGGLFQNNSSAPSSLQDVLTFTSAEVTEAIKTYTQDNEVDFNPAWITSDRVGRVLRNLRLKDVPRSGGKGSRKWALRRGDLRKLLVSYGLPLPSDLFPDEQTTEPADQEIYSSVPPKTSGTSGTSGTVAQNGTIKKTF